MQLKVKVAQNTVEPTELTSITNSIFAVLNLTHWNTDFFGDVVEDSYRRHEYDPADTTKGYFMYFLENGQGVQRDNEQDSTYYYIFTYDFDPVAHNLHVEFETVTDTEEVYNATVLKATPKLFRFQHEWQPNFWELSDMFPERSQSYRRIVLSPSMQIASEPVAVSSASCTVISAVE